MLFNNDRKLLYYVIKRFLVKHPFEIHPRFVDLAINNEKNVVSKVFLHHRYKIILVYCEVTEITYVTIF